MEKIARAICLPDTVGLRINLTANQTIDNRLSGRAAKGATLGRSFFAIPSLRSFHLLQKRKHTQSGVFFISILDNEREPNSKGFFSKNQFSPTMMLTSQRPNFSSHSFCICCLNATISSKLVSFSKERCKSIRTTSPLLWELMEWNSEYLS